jgi:hypothetical protein
MRHRLAADDKSALSPGAPHLVGQLIERINPDMQPPRKAHGAKRVRLETVQGHRSLE